MIFLRHLGDRFSEVVPAWIGETVVVIGCGSSLTQGQVDAVFKTKAKTIAVNDSYLLAPFADVLYAADPRWWRWHLEGIAKPSLGLTASDVKARIMSFAGEWCSIQSDHMNELEWSIDVLRNKNHPYQSVGLSFEPDKIVTGYCGGFQALNIATLSGSQTVLLLGIDAKAGKDGKSHFHDGHPRPPIDAVYEQYRKAFSAAEPLLKSAGIRVINCSPGSSINSFEKMDIKDALEESSRRLGTR